MNEQQPKSFDPDLTRRVYDRSLWQHRYDALDGMITTLRETVAQHRRRGTVFGESRKQTFKVLLTNLQAFAEEQFNFLYKGLGSQLDDGSQGLPRDEPTAYLEPSLEYPADFVLGATLDQIAFDLTVLQGAWYQRVLAEKNQAMARTLEIADKLAYHALLPAMEYELLPFIEKEVKQVTVLTYFQKAPHIRMIPYASVALIGIPFTTLGEYRLGQTAEVGNARDFLAIPHEIGHYVYRHGSSQGSRLQYAVQAALLGQPEWLHHWAEEIFADVYGVLIAGPVMVRDFQDIMRDNDLPSLLNGDSKHPMPVLRPLVYAHALDLLAGKVGDEDREALQELAEVARTRWNTYRGSRGEKQIADRLETIKKAIDTTFGLLTEKRRVTVADLWSLPGPAGAAEEKYDRLYEDFYEAVAAEQEGLFDRLQQTNPPELNPAWRTPLDRLPTLQWLEKIRDNAAAGSGRFPPEVWTLVVSMNGWATDGPEQSPSPKVI